MIYIESALYSLSMNCVVGHSPYWGLKPDADAQISWFLTEPDTYDAVKQACLDNMGEIATIHSAVENQAVDDLCTVAQCSIGYVRDTTAGTWHWSSGDYVVYTNWHPDEPGGSETRTVMINGGLWADYGQGQLIYPGVCRRSVTPNAAVASKLGASEDQVTSWCDSCVSSELECARMCLVDGAAVYNYYTKGGKACRCYSRASTFTPTGNDWKFCTNTGSTSSHTPTPLSGVDVFVRRKPSSTCTPCQEKETSVPSPSERRQCTCKSGLTRTASSISKNWTRSCGPSQNTTCSTSSGQDGSRRWWMVDLETHRSVAQLKIQVCKHESCWSRILGLKLR